MQTIFETHPNVQDFLDHAHQYVASRSNVQDLEEALAWICAHECELQLQCSQLTTCWPHQTPYEYAMSTIFLPAECMQLYNNVSSLVLLPVFIFRLAAASRFKSVLAFQILLDACCCWVLAWVKPEEEERLRLIAREKEELQEQGKLALDAHISLNDLVNQWIEHAAKDLHNALPNVEMHYAIRSNATYESTKSLWIRREFEKTGKYELELAHAVQDEATLRKLCKSDPVACIAVGQIERFEYRNRFKAFEHYKEAGDRGVPFGYELCGNFDPEKQTKLWKLKAGKLGSFNSFQVAWPKLTEEEQLQVIDIEVSMNSPFSCVHLGNMLRKQGKLQEADAEYKKSREGRDERLALETLSIDDCTNEVMHDLDNILRILNMPNGCFF